MNAHVRPAPRLARSSVVIGLLCAVASACDAPEPTAPPKVATTPIPAPTPFAVDTGPIPGGRLAFSYQPSGSSPRIYAVRTDGTGLTQLSPTDQSGYTPTWSPDGSRVAYLSAGVGKVAEIWVVRGDGTGATRIADGHSPFWLDDARVGYACPAGLCVVGADGAQPRTLLARQTPDDTYDDSFRLSPDGTTLAFVRHVWRFAFDVQSRAVYLLKLDGTPERRLFPGSLFDDQSNPAWSPDGKRLAYRDGAMVIVINVDGGPLNAVGVPGEVPRGFASIGPAWSPSGTHLVVGLDPREFYFANLDGSGRPRRVKVTMPSTEQVFATGAWSWTQ